MSLVSVSLYHGLNRQTIDPFLAPAGLQYDKLRLPIETKSNISLFFRIQLIESCLLQLCQPTGVPFVDDDDIFAHFPFAHFPFAVFFLTAYCIRFVNVLAQDWTPPSIRRTKPPYTLRPSSAEETSKCRRFHGNNPVSVLEQLGILMTRYRQTGKDQQGR
jgi:hypothetical protein